MEFKKYQDLLTDGTLDNIGNQTFDKKCIMVKIFNPANFVFGIDFGNWLAFDNYSEYIGFLVECWTRKELFATKDLFIDSSDDDDLDKIFAKPLLQEINDNTFDKVDKETLGALQVEIEKIYQVSEKDLSYKLLQESTAKINEMLKTFSTATIELFENYLEASKYPWKETPEKTLQTNEEINTFFSNDDTLD